MRKKVEGEFFEEKSGTRGLIETLMKSFMRTSSDYGMITDIDSDIDNFYNCVRDYISDEKLDVYALKLDNRILLSRTNIGFDKIYEVIKVKSTLQARKDMFELWDDEKNKILHLIILSIRKHFPIEYSDEKEKLEIKKSLKPLV